MDMGKDVTAFRERFNAYKNGKSISEIYDAGLPRYDIGKVPEQVSDDVIDFIIKNEGGYTGKLSIDPGNGAESLDGINVKKYIDQFKKTGRWTLQDHRNAIREIVAGNRSHIRKKLSNYKSLTKDQQKALDDIVFNIGSLDTSPEFVSAVLAGDMDKAKSEMDWGNNQKDIYGRPLRGLRSRNSARQALWGDTTMTPLQQQQITTVPDAVKVVKTIPQEQTIPAYNTKVSPYISGKPMIHLQPRIKLPNLLDMLDDEWESTIGFKNGKLPGYKGGTPTRVGEYNVYPSAVGAEELNVTTPEIVVTGTDRRPMYQRYDAENSTYDPNAVINGFNVFTLGGFNNVDPTQWARRVYDLPKTMFGPMRFSTYMDRWINGNEGLVSSNFQQQHPWYSAGVNLLGGAALVGGSTQGPRIAHNIANRNQFFYKYLTPFSYDHPLKRGLNVAQKILTEPKINLPQDFIPSWMGKINNGIGKGNHGTYIGYVPEDIIAKAELNGIENTPEYIDYALKLSRLENKFRDAAFRKYLNLPERDPLYTANQDGTFSYNLPYIEQQYAKNGLKIDTANMNLGVDWITGNGGNLESTKNISFGHGIGSDSLKTFSMQEMTDTWDLHPFRRAEDQLSKKYGDFVRKTADNIYTKLYDKLYGHNKPFKYISGYNLLGGKQLNRIRYSDKVPFQNAIDKISKKLVNFEAGPIMGGKPFVMKTNIPLTRQFTLEGKSPVYRIQYGLNADNILPQAYFDWLKHGDKKIASDFELGVPF